MHLIPIWSGANGSLEYVIVDTKENKLAVLLAKDLSYVTELDLGGSELLCFGASVG